MKGKGQVSCLEGWADGVSSLEGQANDRESRVVGENGIDELN